MVLEIQVFCSFKNCDCDHIIESNRQVPEFQSVYKIDKSDDNEPHVILFFREPPQRFETLLTNIKSSRGVEELRYINTPELELSQ